MKSVLLWYFALQLFGFTALPLAYRVFTRLHDRGYGMSKALGLLLVTFVTWLLLFLPGVERWAPFGFRTALIGWAVVAAAGVAGLVLAGSEMLAFYRRRLGVVLTCEAVFLAAFVLMLVFRGIAPHISYHIPDATANSFNDIAAEKFTDFGVMNGLLTSSHFPPHDAWLASTPDTTRENGWLTGGWLNYYYFGHMMWATLVKFTAVRPEVGFNIALAALFALVCMQGFSLGYNLTRRIGWGLLAMFLIALSSNIDGFLQLVSLIKTRVMDAPEGAWYLSGVWYKNYDFWRSSRAVENTITEFPAFSFVLGDLHAHTSALVIFLVGVGICIQAWRNAGDYPTLPTYQLHNLDELFFAALVAGALSAANSWDAITFLAVLGVSLWAGNRRRSNRFAYEEPWRVPARSFWSGAASLLLSCIVGALGAVVLFHFFLFYFHSPLPDHHPIKWVSPENRTDTFEFVQHWVLLLFAPVALVLGLTRRYYRRMRATERTSSRIDAYIPRQRFWAWIAIAAAVACVLRPLWNGWVAIALIVAAGFLLLALINHRQPPAIRLLLGLLLVFCVLTWFCELFYFDDIFEGSIERINTVFKIYYGLWPTMALAAMLALHRLVRYTRDRVRARRAWWLIGPVVVMGGVYPVVAPLQRLSQTTRLGHWSPPEGISPEEAPNAMLRPEARARNTEQALDGLRYLKYMHPDDLELIYWIRENLPGNAHLLEAAGTQYTYSGRVSTLTGRPAFAGWLYHAWGWRGEKFVDRKLGDERNRRTEVAKEIYETDSAARAFDLLLENGIEYVVVGEQERQQYPDIEEQKFGQLGTRAFRSGDTALYKIDYKAGRPAETETRDRAKPQSPETAPLYSETETSATEEMTSGTAETTDTAEETSASL